MSLSSKIIAKFGPTIQLDEISILDEETTGASEEPAGVYRQSKMIGYLAPYIKINDFIFDYHDIEILTIEETAFLPTITVLLIDRHGHFKSAYFPRNNAILSIYIKARHDKLKCVRNDFLISTINLSKTTH